MFLTRSLHIAIICSFVAPASAHAENVIQAAIKNATTPAHRMKSDEKNWWQERHEIKSIEAKKNTWDIIFLGDSITHSWETAGKKTWNKYYQKRNALNLGFSGDRTDEPLPVRGRQGAPALLLQVELLLLSGRARSAAELPAGRARGVASEPEQVRRGHAIYREMCHARAERPPRRQG